MPKTATATAPPLPAQAVRTARSHGSYRGASIEERTAVLEARWEETVPTLATSTDISDLRGEMRNLENRLIKWVIGAGIALLAALVALSTANTARFDQVNARIDGLAARQDVRMDALDAKLDTLAARQDARMDALDAKLDSLATRQDARMDALDAKLDSLATRQDARMDALDAKLDARFDALMTELRAGRK